MALNLLRNLAFVILLGACASVSRNSKPALNTYPVESFDSEQPVIASDKPLSMMDLAQTQDGGFVLKPGFYEAEFKTYCLQPGTPDPTPGDAYLQGSVTGDRKDIVESILLNSRNKPHIDQRNVQLLLWSVVSHSDFDKLSPDVQGDATELLTSKQIFKLKGGVAGYLKDISAQSGALSANNNMARLFSIGASSYEAYERIAVLREPAQIKKHGVKADKWYKQKENYYVRYFPMSYQKVRIQVYVPDSLMDAENKIAGEYVVFDPTGYQATPAFTNAQKLGIGAPVVDIVRQIIKINKGNGTPKPGTPKPGNPKDSNPKPSNPKSGPKGVS